MDQTITDEAIEQIRQMQGEIERLTKQLVKKNAALDHARVRFLCIADEAEKADDQASWAMASVDADRMILALSDD